ncbi:MAG: lysylphosphatidylglycerol synthase transmembrane domain-containing protein [Gammaproteobacteria bacterium]
MIRRAAVRLVKIATAILILAISAWYMWTHFDWNAIGGLLVKTRLDWFLIGCSLIYIAYLCVRTLRWVVMIRDVNPNVHFADLYLPIAILVSLAIITPGQIGEALKVGVLARRGILGKTAGLGSFLIERILDLFVVLVFAAVSLQATRLSFLQSDAYWILGELALLTSVALLALMFFKPAGRLGLMLDQLRLTGRKPAALVIPMILTMLSWLIVAVGWQVSFASVGIRLTTVESIAVMTLTTLGILISFIPSGVGISEMMISEILLKLGIDSPHAQAGAIVMRLMGILWLCIGLFHLFYWWLWPRLSIGKVRQ